MRHRQGFYKVMPHRLQQQTSPETMAANPFLLHDKIIAHVTCDVTCSRHELEPGLPAWDDLYTSAQWRSTSNLTVLWRLRCLICINFNMKKGVTSQEFSCFFLKPLNILPLWHQMYNFPNDQCSILPARKAVECKQRLHVQHVALFHYTLWNNNEHHTA